MTNVSFLERALPLAERGWHVFPLAPSGKRPLTEHGFCDATIDRDQIAAWARQWPNANVGIACGPSGLVVLDVDGEAGEASLDAVRLDVGLDRDEVFEVLTGRGRHLYFAANGAHIGSENHWRPGIDVKAEGGYVVAAGSMHESGTRYEAELSNPAEPTAMPPALIPLLPDPARRTNAATTTSTAPDQIPEGRRNASLVKLAGSVRRLGVTTATLDAMLQQANVDMCVPPLDSSEVASIAASVGRYEPQHPIATDPSLIFETADVGQDGGSGSASDYAIAITAFCGDHEPDIRPADLYVVHGLIARGAPNLIAGEPCAGKSLLAADIAISVALGEPFVGHSTYGARALLLLDEDPPLVTRQRLWRLLRAHGAEPADVADGLFVCSHSGFSFDDPAALDRMRRTLDRVRPDLVVIDSLRRVTRADENSSTELAPVTHAWSRLCTNQGAAIAVVHHTHKGSWGKGSSTSAAIRGSGDLFALARMAVLVNKAQSWTRERPQLVIANEGNLPGADDFVVAIEDERGDDGCVALHVRAQGAPPRANGDDRDRELLDALIADVRRAAQPVGAETLRAQHKVGFQRAKRLLERAVETGILTASNGAYMYRHD